MDLVEDYEREFGLIETWLDRIFPKACADAGLEVRPSAPPEAVSVVARDERWWLVQQPDCIAARMDLYLNTTRLNIVIIADAGVAPTFLEKKVEATTVGARKLGWSFHFVHERMLVCFFDEIDLFAAGGYNSGWIARDLARMLRWLLSTRTAF
jgi:hypothetical protein